MQEFLTLRAECKHVDMVLDGWNEDVDPEKNLEMQRLLTQQRQRKERLREMLEEKEKMEREEL